MGMTANKEIPIVRSVMDYLGRWLALKFMSKDKAKKFHNGELVDQAYAVGSKSKEAFAMRLPVVDEGAQVSSDFQPALIHENVMAQRVEEKTQREMTDGVAAVETGSGRMAQAKLQGYTGSMCSGCGSFKMKRNGACEVCLDCGATSGCS